MSLRAARAGRSERLTQGKGVYFNTQTPPKLIRKYCAINADGDKLVKTAIARLGLGAGAHDRIRKVFRTIAELDGSDAIALKHPGVAIERRTIERTYWA